MNVTKTGTIVAIARRSGEAAERARPAPPRAAVAADTSAQISPRAVRLHRIAAIGAQIASGTYPIDPDAIARAMSASARRGQS